MSLAGVRFPHQLHADGGIYSPRLLESPGEVEQSGSQRRLQHDEDRAERAEPRRVSVRGGPGQQADALPGQLLHDPRTCSALTTPAGGASADTSKQSFPVQLNFSTAVQMCASFSRASFGLKVVSRKPSTYITHSHAQHSRGLMRHFDY